MERVIVTLFVFLFIYFLYIITVIYNKKKMKKFKYSGQASFIIKKYQLDDAKLNQKAFAHTLALTNSAIIAIAFYITDYISHYILKLLVGFVILVPLILLGYHLIGKYYKKKEVEKHV